jgi:hypothetical protein
VPAIERYAGPLWQTLRTADPTGSLAFASVLSAHYGWKPASEPIESYEQRLTPDRARELSFYGITAGWPKFKVGDGGNACHWLSQAAGRQWDGSYTRAFDDVCICGGKDYVAVAESFLVEAKSRGYIAADCRLTVINDQIGFMRQQLRAWLQLAAKAVILSGDVKKRGVCCEQST